MSDLWYVTNLQQFHETASIATPKKQKKRISGSEMSRRFRSCHLYNSYEISLLGLGEDYDAVPVICVVRLNIAAVSLDGES